MGPAGGFGLATSSSVGGRTTRGVLIGVGRGAVGEVGRSGGRTTVGSSGDGGTFIPLVRCGSFTSRATPTSGVSGRMLLSRTSTIAGLGGGATGSVPIGVGRGFGFAIAASASLSSRIRNTRELLASVTCTEPSSCTSTRTLCGTRPCSPSRWKPVFSACIQFAASTRRVTSKLPGSAAGMKTSKRAIGARGASRRAPGAAIPDACRGRWGAEPSPPEGGRGRAARRLGAGRRGDVTDRHPGMAPEDREVLTGLGGDVRHLVDEGGPVTELDRHRALHQDRLLEHVDEAAAAHLILFEPAHVASREGARGTSASRRPAARCTVAIPMTPDEFRALGHQLIEWVASYRERMPGLPVMSPAQPGDVRRQ